MLLEIDFSSDEAFYMQLRNQIILGIASKAFSEGESLPSVRKLSDSIGINMHTVNKAYSVLEEEGFLKIGRRGAVVAVSVDNDEDRKIINEELKILVARAKLKGIDSNEMHRLVDEIYNGYL